MLVVETVQILLRSCRLTSREVAAVVEWEESGKGLHCMRDHPLVRSEYLLLVG